ncbi:MAG TPA: threonine--tRNA ligase, partial [Spirochaetota bacterium]|nr:threonine--tRNA ligase [Spirochaetota bacterium]
YVSTRPAQKAVGDPSLWQEATAALRSAVAATGQNYEIDAGGGAFYGPKIDVKIKDAIGRQWQCSTIQFDFNLPQRFDLTYTDPNSEPARPYMIHRALFGSIERFLGVLIEHYAGKFPFWLAPEQIRILTISRTVNDYADSLYSAVLNKGLRPAKDFRSESLGKKVRDAQIAYIPVILTIGEKEAENNTVSLRTLDGKVLNGLSRESFLEQSTELDRARALQTVFN